MTHTLFTTSFRLEGLAWEQLHLAHMLGVLAMTLHAGDTAYHTRFAAGFILARCAYLAMHLAMLLHVPRARASSSVSLLLYGTTTALAAVSMVLNSSAAFVGLFAAICVLESGVHFVGVVLPAARVPLHVGHTAERMGLIMMVFLGECVGGVGLQPLARSGAGSAGSTQQYTALVLAVVVIWNLHLVGG